MLKILTQRSRHLWLLAREADVSITIMLARLRGVDALENRELVLVRQLADDFPRFVLDSDDAVLWPVLAEDCVQASASSERARRVVVDDAMLTLVLHSLHFVLGGWQIPVGGGCGSIWTPNPG